MLVTLAGLSAACGPPSEGGSAGAGDAATADSAPLDSLRRVFERVVEDNDYEAQTGLYTEDAIVQAPNRPARIGRAAIREGNRRFLTATPDATIDYEPTAAGRGGDYAWEAGSAFETGTDSDGVAHADSGKYLWVWRGGPDGWRIVAHSFSLDAGGSPGAPGPANGEQVVDAFRADFLSAVRAFDADAQADFFMPAGVMYRPGQGSLEGRAEIRSFWTEEWAGRTGVNPLELRPVELIGRGPLFVERGFFGPEGGPPAGRYIWVLERDEAGEIRVRWLSLVQQ